MILIADSGSTKTTWCLTDGTSSAYHTGVGINPFFMDEPAIRQEIEKVAVHFNSQGSITKICYYGTGIVNPEKAGFLKSILQKGFGVEDVLVNSDLTAAARALFGRGEGIAIILGTGTSSGYFSNDSLVNQIPSLGFWLGDEGSGSDLGKRLIKAYLRKEFGKKLLSNFETRYGKFDRIEVFSQIRENARVNAWFASFVPFLKEFEGESEINKLLEDAFSEFTEKAILPYRPQSDTPIGMVGSVAFHFEGLLRKVVSRYVDNELKIIQDPVPGLIEFHVTNVQ